MFCGGGRTWRFDCTFKKGQTGLKPSCWAICLFRQQGVSHLNFVFLFCRFDRRVCTVISMILAGVFCLIFSVASVAFLKAGIDYVVVQGGWGGRFYL